MPNIQEMQSKMTLFYSKQTKEIKCMATGIQDMSYFGDNEIDFNLIYDYIVVGMDEYVFNNASLFIIEDDRPILKEMPKVDYNKYL